MLASAVAATVSLLAVYAGLLILKLPAVQKLAPLLLPLAGVQAVLGLVAAYLALKTYDTRVSKWPSVRRFQSVGV
jgi:heme A synthase